MKTAILHVLEQFPEVKIAYVFGSAARDQLTSTSDIDVAVAAETKLPREPVWPWPAALTGPAPRSRSD